MAWVKKWPQLFVRELSREVFSGETAENLRKYADKCYFAWGSPNYFQLFQPSFSLKQNDFPVWFGGLRGKFPVTTLKDHVF